LVVCDDHLRRSFDVRGFGSCESRKAHESEEVGVNGLVQSIRPWVRSLSEENVNGGSRALLSSASFRQASSTVRRATALLLGVFA